MKKCMVCGEEKELNEFPKKDKTTYRGKCKICYNERKKELTNMSDEEKVLIKEKNIENRKKRLLEREEIKRVKKSKLCKMCGEVNEEMFYSNNKSRCKKCISSNSKYQLMNDNEKNDYKDKLKVWRGDNLIRVRVSGAKHRAVRKGIIFDITDDDIIDKLNEQDNKCYISKVPLSFNENDWYGMSLDRLDSNLGYTKENTIIVTKFVNTSKNNLSLDEYVRLMKEVCDNI